MTAAPRIDPKTVFSPEEWARLQDRDDWRGLALVGHAWGLVALAVAVFALWPNPITWLLAVMVVGARQLGLAILMHEAAHGGLARNQKLNDWMGQWLCAAPVGANLASYRPYHLAHHKFTQQTEDPDLGLAAHFPISKTSFRRKAVRDLTGQTFFKQRIAPLLALATAGRKGAPAIIGARDAVLPYLSAQGVIFALFWLAGQPWAFFTIWMLAQATWFPFVTRVRNIAEHACATTDPGDPWTLARTTQAAWWERLLIAPYWVHYHAEHHLWMHIPCHRLQAAHAMLEAKGLTSRMEIRRGYRDVLRVAVV